MTTVHEAFPDSHEADYTVLTSRQEGERALGFIAAESTREFLWTFDDAGSTWKNHVANHFGRDKYKRGELRQRSLGLTIPNEIMIPDSYESSIYHTHPSVKEPFDNAEIKLQLPSSEDVTACVQLCINGYKDIRIATELGITTMSVDQSVVRKGSANIKGFRLDIKQIREWERTLDTTEVIHKATAFFTHKFKDLIIVDFSPFSGSE